MYIYTFGYISRNSTRDRISDCSRKENFEYFIESITQNSVYLSQMVKANLASCILSPKSNIVLKPLPLKYLCRLQVSIYKKKRSQKLCNVQENTENSKKKKNTNLSTTQSKGIFLFFFLHSLLFISYLGLQQPLT